VKRSVYVETTIVSYLAARRSRNLVVRAHQEVTRRWWRQRAAFDVFASPLVVEEAGRGDASARARRQRLLRGLSLLEITEDTRAVARRLLSSGPLPAQAEGDALHIGVAAVHGMEYLVTWNCRHIANAWMRPQIEEIIREFGYEPPVLCTPEELLENEPDA
jgi:predicted nucleic acid-binding protein